MYINKVSVLGNLTKDPELKSLTTGTKVCTFSIATNEVYKDKNGQKQESVEFHNIIAFGRTGEIVAQYSKKGSQLYVDGKLQTRSWADKTTGEKKYRTEILAQHIQLGSKPKGSSESFESIPNEQEEQDQTPLVEGAGYEGDLGDVNTGDIPF